MSATEFKSNLPPSVQKKQKKRKTMTLLNDRSGNGLRDHA